MSAALSLVKRGKESRGGAPAWFPERKIPIGSHSLVVEFTFDNAPYVAGGHKLKNAQDTRLKRVYAVEQVHGLDINNRPLGPIGAEPVISIDNTGTVTIKFYDGGSEVITGWLPLPGSKLVLRLNG